MVKISTDQTRKIIYDFAEEISNKSTQEGVQPKELVINFRDDIEKNIPRAVYKIPTDILKFRKNNARIRPEVINYEQEHAPINEETEEGQKILRDFLRQQDRSAKDKLKALIKSDGQRDVAIVTADGFLINGNRRKMVLEELYDETGDPKYRNMLAVVLPGEKDPGGPPKISEILEIENRLQFYQDGKTEYSNFAKALSYRDKKDSGISIRHQVLANPEFKKANEKEIKKQIRDIEVEFLGPLSMVDEYLDHFGAPLQYNLVKDRWQAFVDFYKSVEMKISDERWRATHEIPDELVGDIKDVAFKMIRQQEFKKIGKLNDLMRQLPKLLLREDSRSNLLKLVDIPRRSYDDNDEFNYIDNERKWRQQNQTEIIRQVHKAREMASISGQKQKPIDLLEQAFNKLTHDEMDLEGINVRDTQMARGKIREIREALDALEHNLYDIEKRIKIPKDGLKIG